MKKNTITFSSQEEKNAYLFFVKNEYKKTKYRFFHDTWEEIKNTRKKFSDDGIPTILAVPCFLIVIGFLISLFIGVNSLPFTIVSLISTVELDFALENDYPGILPTILKLPWILIVNTMMKIDNVVKFKRNYKELKNAEVTEIVHEDTKNSPDREVKVLINNVKKSYSSNILYEVINGLEELKNKILQIKDREKFKKNMEVEYKLCSLLLRAMNLDKARKEEALRYAINEIKKLDFVVSTIIEKEEKEKEEVIEQVNYKTI